MRKNILVLLCVAFIIQFTGLLPLQAGHYYYKQISLKDGLPSTVRCILTDEQGFVWIGTRSGLGRYDGHELKKYVHQADDPHSIPHNFIYQMIEDEQNNIWILTDKGVARYRRQSDDFFIPTNESGNNIIVYSVCLTKGGVLFGSKNKIFFYNYQDTSLRLLQTFDLEPNYNVTLLNLWDKHTLLCCSRWQGLLLLDLNTGKCRRPPFDCGKEIMNVLIDSQKRIWVAPYNGGLNCLTRDGKLLATYTTHNSSLSNNVILSLAEREGEIWIGTDGGGINILDPETRRISLLEHMPGSDNYSLPANSILCLYNDCNNNMWAGSIRNGLISIREVSMKTYTDVPPGNDRGLSNNTVLSLFQESQDQIWVGTDGGGINIIHPDSHRITVLEHIPGDNYSLPVNSILSLYNDNYNNMWAGSIRKGLINIREVSMKTYTDVFPGSTQGLSDPTVLSLYQDEPNGRIWIGTDGGGVNSLDPVTEEFRHDRSTWGDKVVSITGFTRESILLSVFSKGLFVYNKENGKRKPLPIDHPDLKQYIYYSGMAVNIYRDEPGSVLLLAGHTYRYDIGSQKIRVVNEEEGMEIAGSMNAIAHNERFTYLHDSRTLYELDRTGNRLKKLFSCTGDTLLYSVSMDEKGDFWIGSNTGLGQYSIRTRQYHPLITSLFGEASSVICDHRGKVWIGADHMLFAWMLQSRKFILFGESDGVIPNEYLAKPRLVSGKGEVYMGGVNGLLCIDNRFPATSSNYPEVVLTDVRVNGEPATNRTAGNPDKLTLPQDSRAITLRVMSHEEDIFRKKRYRYRIDGLNEEPIESYDPELVIRSLPAGNYRIQAACSTQNGDWTPFHPILSLTILPPWYRSGWFIICLLLFVSGGITAIIFAILRRRKNRLKWELKERELQEYEEKIRFLVNVSNELLPSFTEKGERELQIVELIRNRLRNGEKSKAPAEIASSPNIVKEELSQPDETFLRKLNQLITDHLDSPELDVTFLCTEMGLSRASLYNKLKAMTNMGANDYINKFRMEKAIQLISTTDLTFTEIAEKIGFTTSRYFSTSFKQYTGETPTQYKEKIRKSSKV